MVRSCFRMPASMANTWARGAIDLEGEICTLTSNVCEPLNGWAEMIIAHIVSS